MFGIHISEVAINWLRILNIQANHQETDENVEKVHKSHP